MDKLVLAFLVAICAVAAAVAMPDDPLEKELGAVKWTRDFDHAKKHSARTGKPLLMFFQEVPG